MVYCEQKVDPERLTIGPCAIAFCTVPLDKIGIKTWDEYK